MSVINQMLRDLDARQASEQERAGLPPRLRPLPPARSSRAQSWRYLLIGMALGGLVAGLAVAWLMAPPPSSPPQAVLPAPTFSPATAASPAPATPAPPAAGSAPAAEAKRADLGEMKLATQLALPQAAPGKAVERSSPTKSDNRQEVREPAAATVKTDPAPAVPAPEAQIDKQSRGGPGRELAEAEYRKGMQAVKRGEPAVAQPLFQHALELDPQHARARQALLSVLVGAKAWEDAKRVAQAGLMLDPAQTGWAVILARLQFEQGELSEALATLEKHAAYAAQDADYQSLYAFLLQKQQRFAEAAERFRAALALRPAEGRWWFGLAVALEQVGRLEEARQAYAKAKEAGNLPAELAATAEQKFKAAQP
ncbi:MAG: tetratricopeptide repeat protein [Rhodocyclaceae bacterium]|nr:tetratricopeptide repeat protein [Rhodocyclaceae bacterium]